jgi:toxin YoeB
MRKVIFSPDAIADLKQYKAGNQNLAFKVLELITDIQSHPFIGLGKPEPLKGNFSGFWSRRISDEHRLIYKITEDAITVHSCFGHYKT